MRVIARKTITNYYKTHSASKTSLEAIYQEFKHAEWQKPSDVIDAFPSADVITGRRFVFNVQGNSFRMVVDIDFKKQLLFIVWIGTHAEYDKIDVKTIIYVKSD